MIWKLTFAVITDFELSDRSVIVRWSFGAPCSGLGPFFRGVYGL